MTTGAPKVMLGTKWPSMISTWIQSALSRMSCEQADPRAAKSAERMEGAMMAGGDIVEFGGYGRKVWRAMGVQGWTECATEILD